MTEMARLNCRVIGARRDGLGARLCALINAIGVAEALDLPYSFIWPRLYNSDAQFHAIDDPANMFSKKYLEEHLLGDFNPERYVGVKEQALTPKQVSAVSDAQKVDGLAIYHWETSVTVPNAAPVAKPDNFSKIGFNDDILEIVAFADSHKLENAMAIHLRRGDILYGENRFGPYNDKYVPLAVVKRIIEFQLAQDGRVVLFSDDNEICAYLKSKYGVEVSLDFMTEMKPTVIQEAFFDLILMSRCSQILGKNSAFSVSASRIGSVPHLNVEEYFQRVCCLEAIEKDEAAHAADYHPLQLSKDAFFAAELGVLSASKESEARERALQGDPHNPIYVQTYARRLLEDRNMARLEEVLAAASESAFLSAKQDTVGFLPPFKGSSSAEDVAAFQAAEGELQGPYVFAYYSDLLERDGKTEDALSWAKKAQVCKSSSELLNSRCIHLLLKTGAVDEALAQLEACKASSSSVPVLRMLLGETCGRGKQHEDAAGEYLKAFELQSENFYYAARAANYFYSAGLRERADELMAVALSGGSVQPTVHYWHSKLAERRKDLGIAIAAMQTAHQLRPDKKNYLRRLELLREKERAQEAQAPVSSADTPAESAERRQAPSASRSVLATLKKIKRALSGPGE